MHAQTENGYERIQVVNNLQSSK